MNLAFYLFVIMGLVVIWFLLSGIYKPLGNFLSTIFHDAIDQFNKDEEKENK